MRVRTANSSDGALPFPGQWRHLASLVRRQSSDQPTGALPLNRISRARFSRPSGQILTLSEVFIPRSVDAVHADGLLAEVEQYVVYSRTCRLAEPRLESDRAGGSRIRVRALPTPACAHGNHWHRSESRDMPCDWRPGASIKRSNARARPCLRPTAPSRPHQERPLGRPAHSKCLLRGCGAFYAGLEGQDDRRPQACPGPGSPLRSRRQIARRVGALGSPVRGQGWRRVSL